MPALSVWYVRTALVHLLAGFTIGALMLANKGVPFAPSLWQWRGAHIDILLVGWLVQLAMGVSFWIVPRWWNKPRRGNKTGAYAAYVLLNGGVILIVISSTFGFDRLWLFAGRLLEVAAAVAFIIHIWPRIVGREG